MVFHDFTIIIFVVCDLRFDFCFVTCSYHCCAERVMDPSELRYLEDEDSPTMKTVKGATTGLVAGTIWGTIVATWYDVPRVERNVALPGLLRTLKMMGNYGMTFAAIGGVYIGVEQLVQKVRMKRDFVNGAVGGFVAGASILGYRGTSFPLTKYGSMRAQYFNSYN